MTKAQMERIVRAWQSRLGLDGWDLSIDWSRQIDGAAHAEVVRGGDYDEASAAFAAAWPSWEPLFANRVVAHELVHLLTRDAEAAAEDARVLLHPQAADQARRRFEHEIEGLVDRLAYRLVEIGGVV